MICGSARLRVTVSASHTQQELRRAATAIAEVARELGGESWRGLMRPVRDTAMELARQGEIEVLRKGKPVEPGEVRGVIRLRIAAR